MDKKLVLEACAFVMEEFVVHQSGYILILGKKHFKEKELHMMIDIARKSVQYGKKLIFINTKIIKTHSQKNNFINLETIIQI